MILCNARAMGEFGAVSVVSGHIRGETNTMPLHVEILYNEYNFVAAFAVASLLALLALVTLVAKSIVEWQDAACNRRKPSDLGTGARPREHRSHRTSPRRFGGFVALERRQPDDRATANWWPCWAPPARARRPCCGSSPAWNRSTRAAARRSSSTAETWPAQASATRQVGFVFQHYALFRHMTVFENIAFGLQRAAAGRPARRRPRFATGSTSCCSWSSSTAWRAAIRRSSPAGSGSASPWPGPWRSSRRSCCLDEPFGALDAKVRQELRRWLRRLHDEIHVTSVFVTHDQEEALEVADRVVVMNHGRIEQVGTPEEVFHHPATPFVMDFLGNVNLFKGRVEVGQGGLRAAGRRSAGRLRSRRPAGRPVRPSARPGDPRPAQRRFVAAGPHRADPFGRAAGADRIARRIGSSDVRRDAARPVRRGALRGRRPKVYVTPRNSTCSYMGCFQRD